MPAVQRRTGQGLSAWWAATSGAWGVWQIDGLRPGWHVVTARLPGYALEHVQTGVSTSKNRVRIQIGPATEAANQSIQFLATE